MTDNVPARVDPADALPAVHRADTDSWIEVIAHVSKFAQYVAGTEFVPKSLRDSPAATTAAIMYGREVGLPPMTALTQTHVIEGKPSMSAEAMRALILAAGHDIEVTESTGGICTMRGKRRGSEKWSGPVTWTIDAARQAGLTNKSNWKGYPRQMLQARCTAELARLVFPDVIHGFRAIEELDDDGMEETPPALPSSSTVKRARKTAAKKTTPAPLETERPALAGPPLPGEEGYEPASVSDERGGSAVHEPAETTSDTDASDQDGAGDDTDAKTPEESAPSQAEESGGEAQGEGADPPDPEVPPNNRGPRKSTRAQHRMIFGLLNDIDDTITDADRHDIATGILGRQIGSFNDLTHDNASVMIDMLGRVKTREELDEILRTTAERWAQ